MGGRSSITGQVVTVFGCSGFVGRYLVNRLGQIGTQVVLPYRGNEYDIMYLRPMGDLGKTVPLRFHLKNQQQIYDTVKNSNVVINLIAQDRPTRNFSLQDANVDGAISIAQACADAKVSRFIHVSHLMASDCSASPFLRSKAEAEARLKRLFPQTIIVRPSVLFGNEDRFLNSFGMFARFPFGLPYVNGGNQLRYPLYVGDLAEGLLRMTSINGIDGKTFDLFGPHEYTFKEVLGLFADLIVRPRHAVELPPWMLWLVARMQLEWRRPLFTKDYISQMSESECPDPGANLGFGHLGMHPASLGSIEELGIEFVRCFRHLQDYIKPLDELAFRSDPAKAITALHHAINDASKMARISPPA